MRCISLGELISKAKVEKCGSRVFPVLSMTMHDGIVFQNDRFKKDIASIDRSNYSVVNRNQLVVSFPIDEGVLAVQNITDAGIVSPAYKIWDIDQSTVIPKYLEIWLRSPRSIEYYKSKLRGTTARRRSIPEDDFLGMPVFIPSMEVQHHAVDLIDRIRQIMQNRQRELSALDDLIKARFVEMFGDPEHNSNGWPVQPLDSLCSVGSSKRIYQNEQSTDGVPFWRISDLVSKMDTGVADSGLFIPEEKYLELKQAGLVPVAGDILVTSRGTLGRCYIIQEEDRFYFQDGMISWLSNYAESITPLYLQHLFTMNGFRKQIDGMQAGSTVAYLSIAMLKKLRIMVPSKEVQIKFATFVAQIDKSKSVIQKAFDEHHLLFDSLMQHFFGDIPF